MVEPSVISAKDVESFFFKEIRQALNNQHTEVHPHTEYYLVRLLSDYCQIENLSDGKHDWETPLAIRYLASQQADPSERFKLLKHLADFTLYTTGFFQDSLNLKKIDLDYYISLGGTAYSRLHAMIQSSKYGDAFRETFLELGSKFNRFIEILSEISENSQLAKDSDLLRLYEKYLTTGSERLLKKLHQFGIFPGDSPSLQ